MDEIRTRAGQAARRTLAVERVRSGLSPAQVAAVLGVHVETVRLWVRTQKAGGDAALAGTPHPGRRSFLTKAQQARVLKWLAVPQAEPAAAAGAAAGVQPGPEPS